MHKTLWAHAPPNGTCFLSYGQYFQKISHSLVSRSFSMPVWLQVCNFAKWPHNLSTVLQITEGPPSFHSVYTLHFICPYLCAVIHLVLYLACDFQCRKCTHQPDTNFYSCDLYGQLGYWSMWKVFLSSLKTSCAIFHSGCTNLCSCQKSKSVPLFLHPHQPLHPMFLLQLCCGMTQHFLWFFKYILIFLWGFIEIIMIMFTPFYPLVPYPRFILSLTSPLLPISYSTGSKLWYLYMHGFGVIYEYMIDWTSDTL